MPLETTKNVEKNEVTKPVDENTEKDKKQQRRLFDNTTVEVKSPVNSTTTKSEDNVPRLHTKTELHVNNFTKTVN